jgi:hypothetical protein
LEEAKKILNAKTETEALDKVLEKLIQEVRERLRPQKPTKRIIDHQSSFGEIQEDSTQWVELARKKKTLCCDSSS